MIKRDRTLFRGKNLLKLLIVLGLLGGSALASDKRDTTINVYGVGAKTDKDQKSHAGAGIMYDSEDVKVKIESTKDYIKSGVVLKYNPYTKTFVKVGLNGIHQKMYAPDNTSAWVNQFSGGLAVGYMALDDLYIELGGSYTKLNGSNIGTSYSIADEKTKRGYIEAAKRWETPIGTVDTTANYGRVNPEHAKSVSSYGGGIDYYPTNASKISFKHQQEENNNANVYAAQYGMYFVEYVDNISADTYNVKAGIKIAFDDLFKASTWRAPKNIKPHLSELHRFEDMTFATNMNIQSSGGVEAKEVVATNDAPTAADATADAAFGETATLDLATYIADTQDADNALTIHVVSGPSKGSLAWTGTSFTFTATPASLVSGTDTFTYRVEDTQGLFSAVKTVTITNISEDGNP